MSDEGAEHGAHLGRRVEDELEEAEAVPLLRVVVDGAAGGRRGDADAVPEVVGGQEVAESATEPPYSALGWSQDWLPPYIPM